MSKEPKDKSARIANRRAMHDYFISAKIECGIVLFGTEVKSLRGGHAHLQGERQKSFAMGLLRWHHCDVLKPQKINTNGLNWQ